MLDLYLIADGYEPSEFPEDTALGALSLQEWKSLAALWTILEEQGISLSFFEDARLDAFEVERTLKLIQESLPTLVPGFEIPNYNRNLPVFTLEQIFRDALNQGKGIMVFCD
ncbi:hypothetical protein Pan153_06750 [Gimesia panareensis]|uniref:Uncharacterized protein n=1 Tax=Gimesia panareensis TaxID=2527978 RepID=A0A518FI76_9PLAN|nr:hypothetical protein [Gimesia panareensis]QDV16054.1 hypothetical protein Pan153_06750 [Gimesia panareensis]